MLNWAHSHSPIHPLLQHSAFSLDDHLADEAGLTGRVAWRVDILGAEYREHTRADRHELAAGLEERDVAR